MSRVSGGERQMAAQAESMDLSEWEGYGSKTRSPAPVQQAPATMAAPAKAQVQWDDDIPF